MPSGALELNENIYECLKREVWEESGLRVISAKPMGIYTSPNTVSVHGYPYYVVSIQFLVDEWTGELATETDETIDAGFFSPDELPEELADHYYEVIEDFKSYEGVFILK
jgi:ADP-ribose pyrophosphatase YjhB (NUDIX family)